MNTDELGSRMRGVLTVCLLLISAPCFAQHAGLRQQWQPQTESDPRLQQPVETELTCISTRRGLPRLAEKTGVSLSVAAENLDTTGERKFTLIAQGCTPKEIMVQLCEALRECHWDVDTSGAQPAYLLHRNAGVEAAEEERQRAVRAEAEARRREERTTRIEEARRALAMGPEEVAELEKTDPLLARALRYPPRRHAMEAFFALSLEQIEHFAEAGRLSVPYTELPEKAQRLLLQAAQETLVESINHVASDAKDREGLPKGFLADAREQLTSLPARIQRATVYASYSSSSLGLTMSLRGEGGGQVVLAIPPRRARAHDEILEHLLVATGDTKEMAAARLQAQYEEREQTRKEEETRRLQARSKVAPELRRNVAVAVPEQMRRLQLLELVAATTGLSVVSDAYWSDVIVRDPEPLPETMPVQQLLDATAAWGQFEWWSAGKCVVLRSTHWYAQEQDDVPESVVLRYREVLRAQGRFTLDDALALAMEVRDRPDPGGRGWMALPEDLAATGLGDLLHGRGTWAPALLFPLTPEQRAQAERAEGLRLADLSRRQRDKAAALAGGRWGQAMEKPAAVFRIAKSEGVEEGRRYTQYDFRLEWGEGEEKQWTAWARLFEDAGNKEGTTDEHR